MSKGARLVSATEQMKKMMNDTHMVRKWPFSRRKMFHCQKPPCWSRAISRRFMDPEIITTVIAVSSMGIS